MSVLSERSFTSTRRIPEEHFVAAEREAAEARAREASSAASLQSPVEPSPRPDRLDAAARRALPFVTVTAAAVWTSSSMLLWSTIEAPIAIASGAAVLLAGFSTIALVKLVVGSFREETQA